MLRHWTQLSGVLHVPTPYSLCKAFQSSDAKTVSLFQLLCNHQFVKQNDFSKSEGDFEEQGFEFGLLGRELMRNWKKEWLRFVERSKVDKIEKLPQQVSSSDGITDAKNIVDALLINKSIYENVKANKKHSIALPIETVAKENCKLIKTKFVIGQFSHFSDRSRNYELQHNQPRFIGQFFNKPAGLKQKNLKEQCLGSVSERYNVVYQTTSELVIQESTKLYVKDGEVPLTATILSLDVEQLFLATLTDAYSVREKKYILKLHPRLAPIKVIILPEDGGKVTPELSELIEETCQMLRNSGIGCWNGFERNETMETADGAGVPFCIILPLSVFDNGLLYMRQLTTTIGMQVHMSNLKEKLLKYLNAL